MGDNPDYTVGVKVSVTYTRTSTGGAVGDKRPILFIDDIKRGRWEAGRRNEIIREAAMIDGDGCGVGMEAFAAYKDAYSQVRDVLSGIRSVTKVNLPGDKVAKAACLEPILEAGNVYIKAAAWNNDFLREMSEFPNGEHDDIVDALVVAYRLHQSAIVLGHI
jgi:predicted phage terminase large subunit-like protein